MHFIPKNALPSASSASASASASSARISQWENSFFLSFIVGYRECGKTFAHILTFPL